MLRIILAVCLFFTGAWGHYLAEGQFRLVDMASAGFPAWSPDGSRIAFSAHADEIDRIFIITIGTGELTQLTHCPRNCQDPTWSPDGSRIAYRKRGLDRSSHLMVLAIDGSEDSELAPAVKDQNDFQPAWSPDGSRIAFLTSRFWPPSLAVLDLATEEITRVTQGTISLEDPAWSADGKSLIAWNEGFYEGVPEGRLYEIDPASGEPPAVLMRDSGGFRDPSWIAGGGAILYRSSRESVRRLFIQHIDRLEPREVGPFTMGRIHPALSPDGTTLAFVGTSDSKGIWLAQLRPISSIVSLSSWAEIKQKHSAHPPTPTRAR